jgi:hypothetical protein
MTQRSYASSLANNRVEFARCARPTRKGEAPLLAAHAERWASRNFERIPKTIPWPGR